MHKIIPVYVCVPTCQLHPIIPHVSKAFKIIDADVEAPRGVNVLCIRPLLLNETGCFVFFAHLCFKMSVYNNRMRVHMH